MKKLFNIIIKRFKNEYGFTMIELIIVIAIIGIIGAMIIPNFTETTTRSKIKTDVNGLRAIQNAVDLYEAETGVKLDNLETLTSNGYIKNKDIQYTGAEYALTNKSSEDTYVKYIFPKTANIKYKKYIAGIKEIINAQTGVEFEDSYINSINNEDILEVRLK